MKVLDLLVSVAAVVPTLALPAYEKRQIMGSLRDSIGDWQAPGPDDGRSSILKHLTFRQVC